jgi:hypothetical protein
LGVFVKNHRFTNSIPMRAFNHIAVEEITCADVEMINRVSLKLVQIGEKCVMRFDATITIATVITERIEDSVTSMLPGVRLTAIAFVSSCAPIMLKLLAWFQSQLHPPVADVGPKSGIQSVSISHVNVGVSFNRWTTARAFFPMAAQCERMRYGQPNVNQSRDSDFCASEGLRVKISGTSDDNPALPTRNWGEVSPSKSTEQTQGFDLSRMWPAFMPLEPFGL